MIRKPHRDTNIIAKVENLINPVLESESMELVNVEYKKEGKSWYLRIFIDKPWSKQNETKGGITIDDCQNISHQIERLLDVEDVIPHSYILEVSSPGIERPLKKLSDYNRFKGSLIQIYLYFPLQNKKSIVGTIMKVEGDIISIEEGDTGKIAEIPFKDISKAHLKYEF
ncbi:MAG: ribosome maturation factor RimP [Nitrospinae bacterium]|nr:ribosome maturation factor RimP [Nitrospinota bacterium]